MMIETLCTQAQHNPFTGSNKFKEFAEELGTIFTTANFDKSNEHRGRVIYSIYKASNLSGVQIRSELQQLGETAALSLSYGTKWAQLRKYVCLRSIVLFWLKQTEYLMAPGGAAYQRDIEFFKKEFNVAHMDEDELVDNNLVEF